MAADIIRIATRTSQLALSQARWVGDRIVSAHPAVHIEIVEVTTTGDLDQVSPVATLTEVGAFVRAAQQAVLDGRADLAVHSCKDLPVAGPAELSAIYPLREAPWDVLCGSTLEALPPGTRVGTGSPRRSAQLSLLRPDLHIEEIRGNVDTRLGKVAAGEFDAVVLAEAGLRRIGRNEAISYRFPLQQMVPAPGQGALAVEVAAGSATAELVSVIDDQATRAAVEAERTVLAKTGAGCRAALGAYASAGEDGLIEMHGFVHDEMGPRTGVANGSTPADVAGRLIEGLGL
jgi:hydroxymethylbilane synthase